ncbi:hypothetical protein VTK26DRAFT_5505 [Humicola hyalothermophila]
MKAGGEKAQTKILFLPPGPDRAAGMTRGGLVSHASTGIKWDLQKEGNAARCLLGDGRRRPQQHHVSNHRLELTTSTGNIGTNESSSGG